MKSWQVYFAQFRDSLVCFGHQTSNSTMGVKGITQSRRLLETILQILSTKHVLTRPASLSIRKCFFLPFEFLGSYTCKETFLCTLNTAQGESVEYMHGHAMDTLTPGQSHAQNLWVYSFSRVYETCMLTDPKIVELNMQHFRHA